MSGRLNVPQEDVNNRVASVMIGGLEQGESKTMEFTMTVPENLRHKGERILVGNAVAYVGGSYVVDSNQDTVSIGKPGGVSTLKFAGATAMSLLGVALVIRGRFW